MSQRTRTFVEQYLANEVGLDSLDDFIDEWHNNPVTGMHLHEYLGLTWEEYQEFIMKPDILKTLLRERVG